MMLGIVMYSKATILGVFALLTALTISGISVMGILQSSERVGTSGIITRPAPVIPLSPPPPSQPPPEPAVEIDIYMDPECTETLNFVNWGTIESGGSSEVKLYVKNNGDNSVLLGLFTENWNPTDSDQYIRLSWDYDGTQLSPGEVRAVNLNLNIDEGCPAISNFGFDIVIIGS